VAKYGWNEFDTLIDYQDWSIGVTKDVLGVTLGLSYADSDLDSDNECGRRSNATARSSSASPRRSEREGRTEP